MITLTKADTCRNYVLPNLYAAGWTDEQLSEQKSLTDGRTVIAGSKARRGPQKRADYLLWNRRDFPIAIVEAKSIYKKPGDGLQQAKEYAQILGLKVAYATNGEGVVETDFLTGKENDVETFPALDVLWERLRHKIDRTASVHLVRSYFGSNQHAICDIHYTVGLYLRSYRSSIVMGFR